jgi:hypothetical protein
MSSLPNVRPLSRHHCRVLVPVWSLSGLQNYSVCVAQALAVLGDPNAPLPWEGDGLTPLERKNISGLWDMVAPLLHRDPLQRGTVAEFRDSVNSLMSREL